MTNEVRSEAEIVEHRIHGRYPMTRMMSPEGLLGDVPEDKVAEAQAEGFRVMTAEDMKLMYNRLFLQHALHEDQRKKVAQTMMGRRQSRRMQMRARRGQ